MRLANSVVAADGSAEYGRLEVFHDGGWGTVCDNAFANRFRRVPEFNAEAREVACRQLGYQRGSQIQRPVCTSPSRKSWLSTLPCGLQLMTELAVRFSSYVLRSHVQLS